MKKIVPLVLALTLSMLSLQAQKHNFKYKFYGFVRGDLFFNSRANAESFDGVFLLFPLDRVPDANGKDLNGTPNLGFNVMTTRFGLNINGPKLLGAQSFANVEGDFAGFGGSHTMIRLRHAYLKLDWDKGSSVLFGQTWHPMFGEVIPSVLNVSTGAPFQPFSRTPQLRYQYRFGKFSVMGAALFQYQYLSSGPYGKSSKYARDAVVPEFFASLSYKKENLLLTAGVDVLTIKPRTQSEKDGEVYKVKESLTTPSVMVAGSYSRNLLRLAAKVVYGKNLSYLTMNGGYGVHDIDPLTGAYTYTPYANLTSWFNVTYGKKWQGGLFLGHSKNLGTTQSLVAVDKTYGQGLNIDNLLYAAGQFSFNIPDFTVGLEYGANTAYYGTQSLRNGRVLNPYAVTNHRILLLVIYYF